MSSQAPLSDEEFADTIRRIGKFKVAELKDLSRSMELRLTGKKQELNDRIVQFLEQGKRFNDNLKLLTIRTLVLKRQNHDQLPSFKDLYSSIQSGAFNYTNVWNQYMKHDTNKPRSVHAADSTPYKAHSLYFTESPFYHLKRMVHGSPQVAFPSKGRVVCDFNIVLNQEENELLLMNNPLIRFYLLCGVQGNTSPSSTHVPLQFPNPLEIHVNGNLLKENVKGIKGKPGTSKPGDITSLLKKSPDLNKIQMVYTTTNDTYLLYLYIVEVISCDELIKSIVSKPHIHINSTISQICKNAADEDDDLVVSTSVVTLRDPLSYTRMTYPAQSIYCSHVECFDALIFLESQKQLPTWSCPHCHKTISINDLAISDYLLDIIRKVPDDIDHVIINQDGSWETEEENKDQEKQTTGNLSSITTKKEVEEKIKIPDVIEIVSLDSESEDDADISMAGPNVPLPNSGNSTSTTGVVNDSSSNNISSNSADANIESVIINDSETDSDDERPLARRSRRPPIISTSPNASSASSSQPQLPQMYEFSATNSNRMVQNRNIIHGNEGNGTSNLFSSKVTTAPTAPVGYNNMSNYPHIQPKMPNTFQPNNQPHIFLSHSVHNAGHSIPTSRYGNREIGQNNDMAYPNYSNVYPDHVSDLSRKVIHPSMSLSDPSNLYPKGFQNILMLQQRHQHSQRQLHDKYNEMTLLMQKNIKQADNKAIRSQPQSPVISRLPDQHMHNHSSFRKIAPSTTGNDPSNFTPVYRHVSAPILGVSQSFSASSGVNHNNGRSTGNISGAIPARDSLSKATDNLGVDYGVNNRASDFDGTNNSRSHSTVQDDTVPCTENTSSDSNMTIGVSKSDPIAEFLNQASNDVQLQNSSTKASEVSAIPAIVNQEEQETNTSSTPHASSTDQLSNDPGSIEGNLGMRFSKSVFELSEATKSKSNNANNSGVVDNVETPASKKQKIVGLLGISLDDDIFPLNGESTAHHGQEYQVSPINGRINNIQLETPGNGVHSRTGMESGNNSNPGGHNS